MANEYLVNSADLTSVADAIRAKGGTSDALTFPGGFVEAIGAIQAGATKEGWVRPSDWPNYDLIDRTNMEAIFFTYSCKDIIREPTLIDCAAFKARTTTGEYLVERGNIAASGFTSVASFAMKSDAIFSEILPADEGDYVVYKISPVTEGAHLTGISMCNPKQINVS